MIAVIDSGMGNVGSVANMLLHLGIPSRLVRSPEGLDGVDRIIMPGVGAFDRGMAALESHGFIPALRRQVDGGVAVLGICLGFQLMCRSSAEGTRPGLGWLDAEVVAFDRPGLLAQGLRVPHLGWADVQPVRPDPLFAADGQRFYFVHSFHVRCADPSQVVAIADHGGRFTACARRGRIVGVQFHPEKSHRYGMELLRRFAEASP